MGERGTKEKGGRTPVVQSMALRQPQRASFIPSLTKAISFQQHSSVSSSVKQERLHIPVEGLKGTKFLILYKKHKKIWRIPHENQLHKFTSKCKANEEFHINSAWIYLKDYLNKFPESIKFEKSTANFRKIGKKGPWLTTRRLQNYHYKRYFFIRETARTPCRATKWHVQE